VLKGFGKNYFTLTAIQAYSSSMTLKAQVSALSALSKVSKKESDTVDEDDPPTEELLEHTATITTKTPCHCDCFFRHKTRLATLLFHFIPRCRFYNKFFAFRRTGIHPPTI